MDQDPPAVAWHGAVAGVATSPPDNPDDGVLFVPEGVTVTLAVLPARPELDAIRSGAWLRARRKALGLSAQDVVDATGIPRVQYLSHLERGVVHPGHSSYWPALQRALRLTAADTAAIEGREESVTAVPDVRYPVPLALAAEGTGAQAYVSGTDILVVDHNQTTLAIGCQYVAAIDDRVVRGRAVDAGGLALLVGDTVAADSVILGRVVHEGHST